MATWYGQYSRLTKGLIIGINMYMERNAVVVGRGRCFRTCSAPIPVAIYIHRVQFGSYGMIYLKVGLLNTSK